MMIQIELTEDEIKEIINCIESYDCEYGGYNFDIIEKLEKAMKESKMGLE